MILLITYDLKQPDRDYTALYDAIKNSCKSWWHYMESVWIINTNLSINSCSEMYRNAMDENDMLLVVDITNMSHQGWLPSKAWEWFKKNECQ